MSDHIPEFGTAVAGVEYVLRPGGYAVVWDASGQIAAVRTPGGLMLIGGGQDPGESPEAAVVREADEECGMQIALGPRLGTADELVYADDVDTYFRKRCTFFSAAFLDRDDRMEFGYELVWLDPDAAAAQLRHESQRWAVNKCLRI